MLLVGRIELVHPRRQLHAAQTNLQQFDPLPLLENLRLGRLRTIDDRAAEVLADRDRETLEQFDRELALLVERKAEAEAEFGVVLEERVRPGRTAALRILRPRRRRQIAAEDRRTAGGICDDSAVAEELRHELQVGSLAASGAGAGK